MTFKVNEKLCFICHRLAVISVLSYGSKFQEVGEDYARRANVNTAIPLDTNHKTILHRLATKRQTERSE